MRARTTALQEPGPGLEAQSTPCTLLMKQESVLRSPENTRAAQATATSFPPTPSRHAEPSGGGAQGPLQQRPPPSGMQSHGACEAPQAQTAGAPCPCPHPLSPPWARQGPQELCLQPRGERLRPSPRSRRGQSQNETSQRSSPLSTFNHHTMAALEPNGTDAKPWQPRPPLPWRPHSTWLGAGSWLTDPDTPATCSWNANLTVPFLPFQVLQRLPGPSRQNLTSLEPLWSDCANVASLSSWTPLPRTVPGATSGSQTPGHQASQELLQAKHSFSPHQPSTLGLLPTWPFPLCSAMGPWEHPSACGMGLGDHLLLDYELLGGRDCVYCLSSTKARPAQV